MRSMKKSDGQRLLPPTAASFVRTPTHAPGKEAAASNIGKERRTLRRPPSKMPYWNRDRMEDGPELAIDNA